MGFIALPAMNPLSSFIEDFANSFEDSAILSKLYKFIFAMVNKYISEPDQHSNPRTIIKGHKNNNHKTNNTNTL